MTETMYDAVLMNPDGTEHARMHVDTVNGAPRRLIEHTLEASVALANGRTERDVVVSGWSKDDNTSVPPDDVRYRLDWIERRTDDRRTP